jgi:hypothetical protein
LAPSLEGSQLYAKFDSVSLSESPVENVSTSAREGDRNGAQCEPEAEVGNGRHEQDNTGHDSASEPQHRAVYSDESHPYPATVEANSETRPPTPSPSELPPGTPTTGDDPESPAEQPHPQKDSSTPSLHLPPVASPSAASSSSLPSPNRKTHKATRSSGPSAFEKVVNKTRPPFLPPKSRDEDQKHMADWEKMMKRSRAAGAP